MYVVVLFVEEDEGGKIIVSSPGSYRLAEKDSLLIAATCQELTSSLGSYAACSKLD